MGFHSPISHTKRDDQDQCFLTAVVCVCVPQKSIINWITNFTPDIKSLGGNTIFPLHFLQPAFVAPFSVGRTNLEADSGQET